jgi:hypothetical protein
MGINLKFYCFSLPQELAHPVQAIGQEGISKNTIVI